MNTIDITYDIIFIDGLEDRIETSYISFINYLFPIAAVIEKANFCFKILNISLLEDLSLNSIVLELKKLRFHTIGMTTNSDNILNVLKITDEIKSQFSDIPIILGGSQASYDDLKIMSKCNCDIIVRHEGEYIIKKLLNYYIHKKGSLDTIKSITYRKGQQILRNQDNLQFIDLNKLPIPKYEILTNRKYWHIPDNITENNIKHFFKYINIKNNFIILSRGCPYNCIFCVEGNSNRMFRQLDVNKAAKYIERFLRVTRAKNINIADSTFTTSPKRVKELCSEIVKLRQEYDFRWYAEGRANILAKSPELIGIMRDAGMFCLQIGIESGSDNILRIQQKKITTNQLLTVAKEIGKYDDIMLSGHLIMGNPGETKASIEETINFTKELFLHTNFNLDIKIGYLVPYVGTPIREKPELYNLDVLVDDFEYQRFDGYNNVIVKPKDLSIIDLENLYFKLRLELHSYYRKNIFTLPKTKIDALIKFYRGLEKDGMYIVDNLWINSIYSLTYFQKYSYLFEKPLFLNKTIDANTYPLRLCEFFYNNNNDSYQYVNVKGDIKEIKDQDKILWEMADGRNTILEIIEKTIDLHNEKYFSLEYAIDFYKNVYLDFVLFFKNF